MNKRKYVPDFPAMMRLYEVNYVLLKRVMQGINRVGDVKLIQVESFIYQLQCIENTPYTNVLRICQKGAEYYHCQLPELRIRLYHDALMAEVCASQQITHFRARYDYPNKKCYVSDEKHQINQFLADWLRHCLKYGTIPITIT